MSLKGLIMAWSFRRTEAADLGLAAG